MWGKKKPTIFIVEDNKNNHPLFEAAFTAAGYNVTLRRTADGDFVEEVADVKPDIISLDIMIGKSGADVERDGLEAARLLKEDERTKNIPIMILTNFFEESKVQQAKETGAVDFINLQAHDIDKIPDLFSRYIDDPKHFKASHPLLRN